MIHTAKRYATYIKLSLFIGTAYKWQVIWGFVTGFFIMIFYVLLWNSIYANSSSIGGYSLSEILTYFLLVQIVTLLTGTRIDREISRDISRGNILNRLIRPINIYVQGLFSNIGANVWNLLMKGIPVLIVSVFMITIQLPLGLVNLASFVISLILAFLISYNVSFLAGISAAWILGSEGIIHAKDFIIMVCAGSILPLSFYPSVVQTIFEYMPFKFIMSVPLNIYLSKVSFQDLAGLLVEGLLWLVILTILNVGIYKKALKKLTTFGG